MTSPTLRDIARQAGVGLTTVSLSLRDSPKISTETKNRVRKVAESLGYRPDPLVAAYQARVRSLQPVHYQATIGWIDDHPDDYWPGQPEYLAARARATTLGYNLDIVRLENIKRDNPTDTVTRFQKILRARGIHAVILPRLHRAHLVAEDWPDVSVVLLGHELGLLQITKVARNRDTVFHEVAPDTPYNLQLAIRSLKARGYCRIGLAVSKWFDQGSESQCSAGYLAHSMSLPEKDRIPPCIIDDPKSQKAEAVFGRFVKKHRPDAVLISNLESLGWCKRLGLSVPRKLALAHVELSSMDTAFSGIDPRLDLIASSAVDLVTAHLQRNERGEPPFRKRVLIPGVWRDAGTA